MNVHEVVVSRNNKVIQGLVAFVLGAFAFLASINLIVFVWLGGFNFWDDFNMAFMGLIAGLILVASLVQGSRMSRDGRRVSEALGGMSVESFRRYNQHLESQLKQLENIVDELAIAASLASRPAIYVLEGQKDTNAFACGMRPPEWCITVSEGAVFKLDRNEMQALVGHELAHLISGDTRNAIFVCAYISGLAALASLGTMLVAISVTQKAEYDKDGNKKENGLGMLGLGLILLGGIGALIATLLEASLSRDQEFRADAEAVRLTRDSSGLVSLLMKLADEIGSKTSKKAAANLWDRNCMNSLNFSRGAKGFWFNSHPPLIDRIRIFDPEAANSLAVRLQAKR